MAEKQNRTLAQKNQLLILWNFATLQIKGLGRMAASEEIARQWHDGVGIYFARWVRALARHYQLFEQLPPQRQGGDCGNSMLNNEQVQGACNAHLSGLATGEVTPRQFCRALNKQILPLLGYSLRGVLSEHT